MKNQAITYSSLEKNIYKSDFYKFDYLKCKDLKDFAICEALRISQNYKENTFQITKVKTKTLDIDGDHKYQFFLSSYPQKLLMRKCARNISKNFYYNAPDRNKSIRELKSCVKWGGQQKIYKIDIASYYESLSEQFIVNLIRQSTGISSHTKEITLALLEQHWSNEGKGLPRGIEISTPIANIALETLDKQVKQHPDCLFYSRFMDDIIVVSSMSRGNELRTLIKQLLPPNIYLNTAKTKTYLNGEKEIELSYLGYDLKIQGKGKNNRHGYREINVFHSSPKLSKLKDKIFKSFLDYSRTKNFKLLRDRLEFLSTNRSFKKGKGKYKSGIYYSNSEINDSSKLISIDKYLYAWIKNEGLFYLKGRCKFSSDEKLELKKINFMAGFTMKIHKRFNYIRQKEITNIWR